MKRCIQKSVGFVLFFSVIIFSIYPGDVSASEPLTVEIPSSPNPVGSGARALGMGGAFIAVADDATAASWNPAGLNQLDHPEISVVGNFFHRIEDNRFGKISGADGEQSVSDTEINYLSATWPFSLGGRNMIVSLNYQHLYDFTSEWNFDFTPKSQKALIKGSLDYQQKGKLSAVGIAYGVQVNLQLSFGLTLNIWDDELSENEWEERLSQTGTLVSGDTYESHGHDRYSFSGVNANMGLMWKSYDGKLTLGAVLKLPFEADLKHDYEYRIVQPGSAIVNSGSSSEDGTMTMPMSYGIGIAWRFSDEFTTALDVYRTEWDDFVITDSQGQETSPITGLSLSESDIDPTCQVRMGAEYLFIGEKYVFPLRGGIFYDPAPNQGSPDDFFGFSIGSGISANRFSFDITYQYRFGNDVRDSILKAWEFSQDTDEHTVYSSLIIYF